MLIGKCSKSKSAIARRKVWIFVIQSVKFVEKPKKLRKVEGGGSRWDGETLNEMKVKESETHSEPRPGPLNCQSSSGW